MAGALLNAPHAHCRVQQTNNRANALAHVRGRLPRSSQARSRVTATAVVDTPPARTTEQPLLSDDVRRDTAILRVWHQRLAD